MTKVSRSLTLLGCLAIAATGSAEESSPSSSSKPSVQELVKLKQNPVSGLRQIVVQADVSPNISGYGRTEGNYSLQAVWPFPLGDDWKVITYTILPVIQEPGPNGLGTDIGLGDTLINLFVSPTKADKLVWGAGPALMLPTRTDPALGSDRFGLGPSAVLYYAEDAWGAGVVLPPAFGATQPFITIS